MHALTVRIFVLHIKIGAVHQFCSYKRRYFTEPLFLSAHQPFCV